MKEKITAISIAITTLVVFKLWLLIKDIKTEYYMIHVIIACLSSWGTYKTVFFIVSTFTAKISCLKKWIFGRQYIDGIWIGAYIGILGEPRIYYTIYTQDYDSVKIKGRSFLLDKTVHTTWTDTSFNYSTDDKIFYTYSVQTLTETSCPVGYAQFNMSFDKKNKFAIELNGYSFDLLHKKQIPAKEIKITGKFDEDKILEKAIDFYNKSKEFFNKFK